MDDYKKALKAKHQKWLDHYKANREYYADVRRKRDAYLQQCKESVKVISREKGRMIIVANLKDGEW